jgi:hypothetical protein
MIQAFILLSNSLAGPLMAINRDFPRIGRNVEILH